MSGVYNRKLFQSPSARDQLRQAGGIMSSSSDLMLEARKSMPQPAMPQPAMQQPMQPMMMQQPMMQQPMMQQPMMQPPMMQPPMMQQPMNYQQAMDDGPVGYDEGGSVAGTVSDPSGRAETPNRAEAYRRAARKPVDIAAPLPTGTSALNYMSFLPALLALKGAANLANATSSPAEAIAADIVATAEDLASRVDTTAPEVIGEEIVKTAASNGLEPSGDLKFDLAAILEEMTGDPEAYEKNINSLNRGIIGAAIGAGTSARATENISQGLLVGMQAAKATEERRAGDARALQLKALEVRAAEQGVKEAEIKAAERAKAEAAAKLEEDKRKAYFDIYKSVMELGIDGVVLPELTDEEGNPVIDAEGGVQTMTLEDYARQVAEDQVKIGFPSAPAPSENTATAPAGGSSKEDKILQQARAALAANKSRKAVEDYLISMGIDPSKL